jgi:predicted  nucleic acid-binding Zn-ribbon protein
MAQREEGSDGVLVQICLECGKEYMFDDGNPPDDLSCDKCGNTVFRSFFAATEDDDVAADYREVTERDTATTDPASDVTRGDLHDLGNL